MASPEFTGPSVGPSGGFQYFLFSIYFLYFPEAGGLLDYCSSKEVKEDKAARLQSSFPLFLGVHNSRKLSAL